MISINVQIPGIYKHTAVEASSPQTIGDVLKRLSGDADYSGLHEKVIQNGTVVRGYVILVNGYPVHDTSCSVSSGDQMLILTHVVGG